MANPVYLELSHHRSDPPTDFAVFVAEQRGLQTPEAAQLLAEWVATYQPQRQRPSVSPQRRL